MSIPIVAAERSRLNAARHFAVRVGDRRRSGVSWRTISKTARIRKIWRSTCRSPRGARLEQVRPHHPSVMDSVIQDAQTMPSDAAADEFVSVLLRPIQGTVPGRMDADGLSVEIEPKR
jgi:hypothetical protein